MIYITVDSPKSEDPEAVDSPNPVDSPEAEDRPESEEFSDYAEVFRSVSCEKSGNRAIMQAVKYPGPVLILDYYHVFPGEVISVEEVAGVLSREKGIYRVLLSDGDVEKRIKEVTEKLSENGKMLGRWKLVFTNPGRYRGFYEFRRFMDDSSGKAKELVFL